MKKAIYHLSFFALGLLPASAVAQYMHEVGGSAGISNYLGDMGGKENTRRDFVADMKMAKTRFDVSLFYRYKLRREIYLKAELSYLRIAGDDALCTNPGRRFRNLSFTNDIIELDATVQWMFYENTDLGASYRFRNAFRAYAFAGVGVFYHNPKTIYNGEKVKLRPLMTEGQETPYKKFVLAIPTGIGFHYTIKRRHRFGWELNWRTTFTDYLDDVKGIYADPSVLDPEAVPVANRTGEVASEANAYQPGFINNYLPGMKRGDPTHNDSFLTTTVSYSYVIRGKSSFYRSKYGSFFHKRGRKVVRRIRSKF